MRCPNCTNYSWRSVAGICENCKATVPNNYQKLCTNCSTTLDECEVCRTNMGTKSSSGSSSSSSQAGYTVKKNMKNHGGSVALKVGNELEVTVDENNAREYHTGYCHDSSIIDETNRGQQMPAQYHGSHSHPPYRIFTFKAKKAGTTTLELDEWQMRWNYSGWGIGGGFVKDKKTGVTWKINVTVK